MFYNCINNNLAVRYDRLTFGVNSVSEQQHIGPNGASAKFILIVTVVTYYIRSCYFRNEDNQNAYFVCSICQRWEQT